MALSNYRPDIDGLRAVSVLDRVLYQLSASVMPSDYTTTLRNGIDQILLGYVSTHQLEEGVAVAMPWHVTGAH